MAKATKTRFKGVRASKLVGRIRLIEAYVKLHYQKSTALVIEHGGRVDILKKRKLLSPLDLMDTNKQHACDCGPGEIAVIDCTCPAEAWILATKVPKTMHFFIFDKGICIATD